MGNPPLSVYFPVAFLSRNAASRVSASKRFASQNLAAGRLCLPRNIHQGSHEIHGFMGTGDVIEGYTMEEIPR